MRRFTSRQKEPVKRWKLTEEDWRNREKRGEYEIAVTEMLERTDTSFAPWVVVEGDDKRYARVKVVETVNMHLERGLRDAGIDVMAKAPTR